MSTIASSLHWKSAMLAACVSIFDSSQAAVTVVDWLDLYATGNPASFVLRDDFAAQAAIGSLQITPGQGQSFPGYPRSRTLAAASWTTPPSFEDSLTDTSQMSTVDLRVVPNDGVAAYRIDFMVPAGRGMILVIGGLFRDGGGATQGVIVSTTSSTGGLPVVFLEQVGWNDGDTSFEQVLGWDAQTGTLSTLPASNGDSAFAFFSVGPLSGSDTRLILDVPAGFASGVGDEITIGLGLVVPEPGGVSLMVISGMMLSIRRRRLTQR